jgi:hypothetical protein
MVYNTVKLIYIVRSEFSSCQWLQAPELSPWLVNPLGKIRQSKIIKQGASGRNGLTYITKKNISKLTCLPVLFWWVRRSPCLPVLFWWVCRSPSACGREAIIHLRVNYRYKRVQMVHILNKYVEYQCTVIPTLSPWQVMSFGR